MDNTCSIQATAASKLQMRAALVIASPESGHSGTLERR